MTAVNGILYLWEGRTLLCSQRGLNNQPHAHYAASLIFTLKGEFGVVLDEETTVHQAVLLAPDVRHRLVAQGIPLVVVHLDPDNPQYQELAPLVAETRIASLPADTFQPCRQLLQTLMVGEASCDDARAATLEILAAAVGHQVTFSVIDGRVRKVLRLIREQLPENPTVAALASEVKLSPDRLMHLFKEQLGMPMRRYFLWQRLRMAAFSLRDGGSLTDAAHAAGFADSAHLSRTFKASFGITPSQVFGHSSSVQVHLCHCW